MIVRQGKFTSIAICICVFLGLFCANGTAAFAQHHAIRLNEDMPLPASLKKDVAVVRVTDSGHFETIREGDNGFFCVANLQPDKRFFLECHPETMKAYLERRRVLSVSEEPEDRNRILLAEIKAGSVKLPNGAISRFASGTVNEETGKPDSARVWTEIYVPFATSDETGLTLENAGTEPWLMSEGSFGAHIMIGYQWVAWEKVPTHFD